MVPHPSPGWSESWTHVLERYGGWRQGRVKTSRSMIRTFYEGGWEGCFSLRRCIVGTQVDLTARDDGSGRQRWKISRGTGDWYHVTIVGGVGGKRRFLNADQRLLASFHLIQRIKSQNMALNIDVQMQKQLILRW